MQLNKDKVQQKINQLLEQNQQSLNNVYYTKGAFDAFSLLLNPEINEGLTSNETDKEECAENEEPAEKAS